MIKTHLALRMVANQVAQSIVEMNNDSIKDGNMPFSLLDAKHTAAYLVDLYEYDKNEAKQIAKCIADNAPSDLKWNDLDPWEI